MHKSNGLRTVNLLIFILIVQIGFGRENVNDPTRGNSNSTEITNNNATNNKTPTNCLLGSSRAELDINNVRALLLNGGDMWWDQGGTGNARYEVPKVDDPNQVKKHSLFAGAIWIGGVDPQGNVLVTAETYRGGSQAYFPGPIVDETALDISAEECLEWDRHFTVYKETIDKFIIDIEAGSIESEQDIPEEIRMWPGKGNRYLIQEGISTMNKVLAPFVDNGDGVYEPLDGDYPDILGDQAIWWIMNDVGGDKNLGDGTVSDAIGLEISTMAFAFATDNSINDATFYKNVIKNKGSNILKDTYIGQWVDADLGNFDDDYVGCDVGRGLGICYNGKPVDEGFRGYGANPPAIGIDFFKGPLADANDGIDNDHDCIVDEEGETIVMSKFMYYNNSSSLTNGNPNRKQDFYNYLRNIWRDGKTITYDGKNGFDQSAPAANYMFPFDTDLDIGWGFDGNCANPVTGGDNVYWDENSAGNDPADRRFLQSAGPFTLEPGAVNEVTIGVVWYRSGSGGATGSLNGLKQADDLAQALFDRDFEILNGPNAPDVEVVELDQEVVLTLIPDEFTIGTEEYNTETYEEIDRKLTSLNAEDPFYRFQGYLVYQLADPTVSVSELENPDRARLISQCDEADGISKLINSSLDPELESFIPELMIKGDDAGIIHTLHITQDAFSSEDLVNFDKYYYMVVAYAHNTDPINDVFNSDGQQYLQGRKNIKTYTAMPHKVESRNGGMILNSSYGSGLDITKLQGVGNGGTDLRLTTNSEKEILQNSFMEHPEYSGEGAPIRVKVYDPIKVKSGQFKLKMYSRLVYHADDISAQFNAGDTIFAEESSVELPNFDPNGDETYTSLSGDLPQKAGKAVIREIYETESITYEVVEFDPSVIGNEVRYEKTDTFYIAKVELLNGFEGGTFMFDYKAIQPSNTIDEAGNQTAVFVRYDQIPYEFFKKDDPLKRGISFEFNINDFWELEDLTDSDNIKVIQGAKRVSEFNEQILPEYGIAIEMESVRDPLYRVLDNTNNGFISAEIVYGENGTGSEWLDKPVVDLDGVPRWLEYPADIGSADLHNDVDPTGVYRNVLEGAWAPYALVRPLTATYGAGYLTGASENKIYDLNNIDVVISSNPDEWSDCMVLQYEQQGQSFHYSLLKSQTGNGMGKFPGYAIDLDRGVRLNMFFSESKLDLINGDNLEWNPTKEENGNRSYVYITNTVYDGGEAYSQKYDELFAAEYFPNQLKDSMIAHLFKDITWVGNMKVKQNSGFMAESNTRIRLRVNKEYRGQEYGKTPEYMFSTDGVLAEVGNKTVAENVLSQIRMVPNPYYAYSQYETDQLSNVVKITNLPQNCSIKIYNAAGTLVRAFKKTSDAPFIDWNLRNQNGIPIAGGVYFAHVEAPDLGAEIVVKWFGVVRPFDLDTF